MSIFDIKQIARELAFPHDEHFSAKEVVAERFIETAVDMINNPSRETALLDIMTEAYEVGYGMIMVDAHILQYVNTIKLDMKRKGWDPRVKIKLAGKKIGRNFYQMQVVMDLDTTLQEAVEDDSAYRLSLIEAEKISEVVSDNPDADQLNEFDRTIRGESASRTPLLSDRDSLFVTGDSLGNW